MATSSEYNISNENLEIFSLIWLDAQVNTNKYNLEAQQYLRTIINHLKIFDNPNDCQKYIVNVPSYYHLVLIFSGQLGECLVPQIHHLNQVSTIYIYCLNKEIHEKWTRNFHKIKAVVTDFNDLIAKIRLNQNYQIQLAETLAFDIFNINNNKADQSLLGLNGIFVHHQVLMDVLLRLKYNDKDKAELIDMCKIQYKNNSHELNMLQKFQTTYSADKALKWYSYECFLYKILNKALRIQDIHVLYLLRSFSFDICQQLKLDQCQSRIRVYRGQLISKNELLSLTNSINQLISINSFFSTSFQPEEAGKFLISMKIPDNLERVLFDIDADPKVIGSKPFADIRQHSEHKDEAEVLFMFGSIFRINYVKRKPDGIWEIKMTLCGDNEHDLKQIIDHMKNEYGIKTIDLQLLGKILWKMGKFNLAEKYYLRLISELPSYDRRLIDLYKELSDMASMKGDLNASVEWKKKYLDMKAKGTHSGMIPPKILILPTDSEAIVNVYKSLYNKIEQRIAQITDSKQPPFNTIQIQNGTREIRMVMAAWIMICKFDCKLYGGFIRDWIVDHSIGRPKNKNIDQWILYEDATPSLNKEVTPADLDCYLPIHGLYDIDKMIDELVQLQMSVRVYRHCWRYILLVDQHTKTGPFMIDLVIPHIGLNTYDRVDCEVNNLYVEKDFTRHLGMRMNITESPYNFTLEKIVYNIKKKRFHLLLAIDFTPSGLVIEERVEKMKNRGWNQIEKGLPPMIPSVSERANSELTYIPRTSNIFKTIEQQMKSSFGDIPLKIKSIKQIKNVELEKIYEQARKILQKETGISNGNEILLFHGAKGKAVDQILNYGFDERSYRFGSWGNGAYFTNNPKTENLYTCADYESDDKRVIYQTKVLLGNVLECKTPKIKLISAPDGYHSIHGLYPLQPTADEYIVYRYGQALPYLKITYKIRKNI